MPMLEKRLNKMFGDNDPTGFGTGWWSGVLSAFFGVLAFGAVICLHFPQLLSSPDLRPYYPMPLIRLLIQAVIGGAIFFGVLSGMLRRKQILPLTGSWFRPQDSVSRQRGRPCTLAGAILAGHRGCRSGRIRHPSVLPHGAIYVALPRDPPFFRVARLDRRLTLSHRG